MGIFNLLNCGYDHAKYNVAGITVGRNEDLRKVKKVLMKLSGFKKMVVCCPAYCELGVQGKNFSEDIVIQHLLTSLVFLPGLGHKVKTREVITLGQQLNLVRRVYVETKEDLALLEERDVVRTLDREDDLKRIKCLRRVLVDFDESERPPYMSSPWKFFGFIIGVAFYLMTIGFKMPHKSSHHHN